MGSVHTRIFIPLRRNDTFDSIGSLDFSISCYGVIIFLGVKILSASKTKWIAGIYQLFQDSMKRVLFSDGLWVETKILFDSKKNLSQTTGLSKEKNIIRKQKQIEHMFFFKCIRHFYDIFKDLSSDYFHISLILLLGRFTRVLGPLQYGPFRSGSLQSSLALR